MAAILIPFQPSLRPNLPTVEGNLDYRTFRAELARIDQILLSGPETTFVLAATEHWLAQSQGEEISAAQLPGTKLTRAAPCAATSHAPISKKATAISPLTWATARCCSASVCSMNSI